ncbi:MAG TPA: hypothetical protein VII06_11580 [Chloroflexota bacterium]|jgi:hypothetical protein
MRGREGQRWARAAAVWGLLLGAWLGAAACARAEEYAAVAPPASLHVGSLAGYQAAAPLGLRLVDTHVDEQVYRRTDGAGEAVVWSASFTSRWALTPDQLDRWSAQAIGLLADALGPDLRLGDYEHLAASDVGDQRIAYRYALITAAGAPAGEATLVVFARGTEVGVSGAGSTGGAAAPDAVALARGLDAALTTTGLVARAN